MDRSTLVGTWGCLGDCESLMEPQIIRASLSQLTPTQVEESLTLVSATDPETDHPPVDVATAPFGLGPVTSIIHQGVQQESDLRMPQITGPMYLVLAVDPEAAWDPTLAPLSCGPGAVPSLPGGDTPSIM